MTEHQRSHRRFLPTYATLVGLPALPLFVILHIGDAVAGRNPVTNTAASPASITPTHATSATTFDLPLLLIQIIVILVAARLTGALVRRLGQPQVVGEMIAGIAALGPSLLGAQAPRVAALLFPAGRWFLRRVGRGGD